MHHFLAILIRTMALSGSDTLSGMGIFAGGRRYSYTSLEHSLHTDFPAIGQNHKAMCGRTL